MNTMKYRAKEWPLVSIVLVSINIIVFLICQFTKAPYLWGSESVQTVLYDGEYGRIIWSMFLHADQNHLFNNMLILFFMGAMIEKEIGHVRYALYYFLSGIGGGLLSLLVKYISGDWSSSIGASGAVFGLDGVLLALVLFSGKRIPSVTPVRVVLMIALSVYSGFTGGNIDNAAHIGGLTVGFILAGIMCLIQRRKEDNRL